MAVFESKLYGSTANNGKLYEWNDVDAWVEVAPQLGESYVYGLTEYGGELYGGTGPTLGNLYFWNDVAWLQKAPKLGGLWPKPPNEKFTIEASGVFTFNVRQLWPDGDWPDEPKIEDVEKLIEREGGGACVISEWNLDPKLSVSVSRSR